MYWEAYKSFSLPAYLKKKEDRIPWAALLAISSIVAFEWPWSISKLLGPEIYKKPDNS